MFIRNSFFVVIWSILCFAVDRPKCHSEEVDVYLLGGQSNMQGVGILDEVAAELRRPFDSVLFWNGSVFETFHPGKTKSSARVNEFGPELGIAVELSKSTNCKSMLIKYFASGMPLHHGWNGNNWVGGGPGPNRTNFYPGNHSEDPNTGKLYTQMIERFRNGLDSIREQGDTPVIRGFAWMQGEQDSKHETSAGTYAASLKRLRARVANDLAIDDLRFVFGQVLPYEPSLDRFTHRELIRQQMAAADMASGKPQSMTLTRMISTDDYSLKKDKVHYDANGQLDLGRAMARQLLRLKSVGKKVELWGKTVPGFPANHTYEPIEQVDGERISQTSKPFMRVFQANPDSATGQAVVIFPGGGYRILADKKEGDRVAAWFAENGITCFVVCYRVSTDGGTGYRFPGPLLDARRAIQLIKQDANTYEIDPNQIGVMGFSAGGHLAGMCATRFRDQLEVQHEGTELPGSDEWKQITQPGEKTFRPAFACLVYPVVSMIGEGRHVGSQKSLFGDNLDKAKLVAASPERQVTKDTPPMFIVHQEFDRVDAGGSLKLAMACKKAKVPCELHIYPGSDHGFGMGRLDQTELDNPAIRWPNLFRKFLQRMEE